MIDQNSLDYKDYLEIYPTLANQPVYILKEGASLQVKQLNRLWARPFATKMGKTSPF